MGDVAGSYSLFALLSASPIQLSANTLVPLLVLAGASGVGASFVVRHVDPRRARPLALGVAISGLLALLYVGLPLFAGYEQQFLFMPTLHVSAGIGLWCLLGLQVLALRTAWKLPVETPDGR